MKKGEISRLPAELRAAVKRSAQDLSRKDYEFHRSELATMAAERLRAGSTPEAVLAELNARSLKAMRRIA